jgi:hypothetical protein
MTYISDTRDLLKRYISVILPAIRYQIINCIYTLEYLPDKQISDTCMYTLEFLPDKQILDIYSMRCLALISMQLYHISETKLVSENQNVFHEIKMSFRKSNRSLKIKWPSLY